MTAQQVRDEIEQAIARGWTASRIVSEYGYDHSTVDRVWDLMDARAAERDKPVRVKRRRNLSPCGTRAAYERHRARKQPVDEACREAVRLYRVAERARLRALKERIRAQRGAA